MEHSLVLLGFVIAAQLATAAIALTAVRRRWRTIGWLLLAAALVVLSVLGAVALAGELRVLSLSRGLAGLADAAALVSSVLLISGGVLLRAQVRQSRADEARAAELAAAAEESERKASSQSEFLEHVLSSLTHPFYVVDANDYTVRLANAASGLGTGNGGLVTCHELTHGRGTPCEDGCPLAEVRRTRGPVSVAHSHTLPDGTTRHVDVHGYPIFGSDGSVVQMIEYNVDVTEQRLAERALRESEARWRSIVESEPECVKVLDAEARVVEMNPAGLEMIQGTLGDIRGKAASDLVAEANRPAFLEMVAAVFRGERRHLVFDMIGLGGRRLTLDTISGPLRDPDEPERVLSLLGVSRDVTERRRQASVNAARLHLLRFAMEHSMEDLLEETLNETERLTGSLIGFYHFVGDDQDSVLLQNWSTRTKSSYCRAQAKGLHYAIEQAGVWVDCVHERRAVVHNDYPSLPHRKGIPDGHAALEREVVVPVLRGEKVAAVMGVGNKPEDYGEGDVEVVSAMADLAWDIVERKRAEEALRRSEAKFRAVVENSHDGVIFTDAGGRIVYRSPSFERITGFADGERVGRSAFENIHPDDLAAAEQLWARVLATPRTTEWAPTRVRHRDGSWRWLEVSAENLLGDPNVEAVVMTCRDVTERKRLEDEMRRAAAAMEQAAEAIVITDPDAVIQYVNPAFTEVTGYPREEAIGKNPRILQSGRHGSEFYDGLWETLRRGEKWTGRFFNARKDGRLYQEEASIAPVRDKSGRVVHYVAVKRDVTREVELAEQLGKAKKMEALGSFASSIAHDFNNLIMVIRGTTEHMLGTLDADDSLRTEMNTILRSARSAGELTGGLLSFARRQVLQPQVLRLDEVVRGLLPMLRRLIPENCEVRFETGSAVGNVRVDLTHFEQVLLNLCVNARDAMPAGGTLTLSVANANLDESFIALRPWTQAGRYVAVTIADTGVGMDSETLSHVFEPFFTTKSPGRGTGLGLATAYGLVKQHGGVIDVSSEPGKGSAFTIYLPEVDVPEHVTAVVRRDLAVRGRGERVLVAEDQPELRRILARSLEEYGYQVTEAADGAEALEKIAGGGAPYDAVVTDMIMPAMGGIELYRRVREVHPRLPVLLSSGYGDMGDSYELPDDPYLAFMAKPYEVGDLARRIRAMLDQTGGET